jgi:hypothetical protein
MLSPALLKDPYTREGSHDSLFDAVSENGDKERGGITSDGVGLEEENHWVELFGVVTSDDEFSKYEEEADAAGPPTQSLNQDSMVRECPLQRGIEGPLQPEAVHSADNSMSREGTGPFIYSQYIIYLTTYITLGGPQGKPLLMSEKVFNKGGQHHPNLFLDLRIHGGSAQPRRSVFVDIPLAPYPIPSSSLSEQAVPSNQAQRPPLQDTNLNRPSSKTKRKRSPEDADHDRDQDYTEPKPNSKVSASRSKGNPKAKGKEKENTLNQVSQTSRRKKQKTRNAALAGSEGLPYSSSVLQNVQPSKQDTETDRPSKRKHTSEVDRKKKQKTQKIQTAALADPEDLPTSLSDGSPDHPDRRTVTIEERLALKELTLEHVHAGEVVTTNSDDTSSDKSEGNLSSSSDTSEEESVADDSGGHSMNSAGKAKPAKPIDRHKSNICLITLAKDRKYNACRNAEGLWPCYCNNPRCHGKYYSNARALQQHITRGSRIKGFHLLWTVRQTQNAKSITRHF